MKIIFISNFLTHHQLPLLDALNGLEGVSCLFVETEKMPEHRVKLGYRQEERSFVVPLDRIDADIEEKISGCDALITGGIRPEFIRIANRYHKPVFVFSERLFKDARFSAKNLLRSIKYRRYASLLKGAYLLCASGYAYADYVSLGLFRDRAYQWGYFPAVSRYESQRLLAEKDHREIVWCARFLDWKHYDDALEAARRLKDEKYEFRLTMIGIGEGSDRARAYVNSHQLNDCVRFLGAMPTEQVRKQMERAGIFLFTSDRKEGWGAVLNEAMNSACAVVSSDAAGAAPVLITHGQNGLIYRSRNVAAMLLCLKRLLDDPSQQKQLGQSAYQTIAEEWNPQNAARRFVKLCRSIKSVDGSSAPQVFDNGVCAKTKLIRDGWFKEPECNYENQSH